MVSLKDEWYNKLVSFGIPERLALRASEDLARENYDPYAFPNLSSLLKCKDIQKFDWFDDISEWIEKIKELIGKLLPGGIMILGGGFISSMLSDKEVKGIPLSLIGLAPTLIGLWQWYNVFKEYML